MIVLNKNQITTERLSLKLVEMMDLDWLYQLLSLPEVDQYNTLGIPENREVTRKMIAQHVLDNCEPSPQRYTFSVLDKSNGIGVGLCALNLGRAKYQSAEIWYKYFPQYWGKGFASETVKALLDFGFQDLQLQRIEAGCAVGNIGSVKVLEKSGFTKEGRQRKTLHLEDGWSDHFDFGILRSEHLKSSS